MKHFEKLLENIRKITKAEDKKKLVENSIIIVIIGVILIIAGGSLFGKEKSKEIKSIDENRTIENATEVSKNLSEEDKDDITKKVEQILSQIDGAGKVSVMITYNSGKEVVPAYDTKKTGNQTEEKDTGGGTRQIKQDDYENQVVYEEKDGAKKPMIVKEISPQVKGVIVVAEGAANIRVRDNIVKGLEALLDVPIHKVQVFERKK